VLGRGSPCRVHVCCAVNLIQRFGLRQKWNRGKQEQDADATSVLFMVAIPRTKSEKKVTTEDTNSEVWSKSNRVLIPNEFPGWRPSRSALTC